MCATLKQKVYLNMFSIRLKELRMKNGLSQRELANAFKVSTGTVGNWEVGSREPDFSTIIKLADYFRVSVDYLIGHSDNSTNQVGAKGTEQIGESFSTEEKQLIKDYRTLNFACKKLVKQTIETLKNSSGAAGAEKKDNIQ